MNERMNESSAPALAGTRQQLLDAALRCLDREGMTGATSRAIAGEAGANLQAITYHFGSKDRLVSEALALAIRRWLEPALDVLSRDMDPFRRMMMAIDELQDAFDRARDYMPVYLEALARAHRDELVARAIRDVLSEIHGIVSTQIADLKRRKLIPSWVDPDAMATLQMAAVDGLAMHASLDRSIDHRVVAKQAGRLLFAARRRRRDK